MISWELTLDLYVFFLTIIGTWFAFKNNDNWAKVILTSIFILKLLLGLYYVSYVYYAYFIFCIGRFVYRKIWG